MNIPKGFQLHIRTWENDGDHYKTQVFSGLTEQDVRFYLDIVQNFKSRHTGLHCARKPAHHYGNGAITGEELIALIHKAVERNPNISQDIRDRLALCKEDDEDDEDDEYYEYGEGYYEFLLDLLGFTEEYGDEHFFCRVFDRAEVYYFPADVQDVTEKFPVE